MPLFLMYLWKFYVCTKGIEKRFNVENLMHVTFMRISRTGES